MSTVAVINGVVCVARSWVDIAESAEVIEWLPTRMSEHDLFASCNITSTSDLDYDEIYPGEVFIGIRAVDWRGWVAGCRARLVDGPYTQPIRVDRLPIKIKKTRKGK